MKILVTGAAGFIGSNLSEYLLNRNYEVVGIDNFNSFYNPKIKEYNIKDFATNPNFHLYKMDLLDVDQLDKVFANEKIDAVIHLAAWAGVTNSIEQPTVYVRNNEEVTVNLLEMCKKYSVGNFLFASTSSIYGDTNPTPFTEDMNTDYTLAPYPATKKASEVMIYTYSKNFNQNATIFRIFNPNGPRMRPDLALPILVKSCLYGVEFKQYWSNEDAKKTGRDYCFVEHIFEAMEYVLQNPFKYEVFNLGNSSPVTLDVLIQTVEKVTGKKANIKVMPPRQGEMMVTFANIDKAKKMIKYNPATSLEQIVKIYYDWFVQQEEWYRTLSSSK